MTAVCSVTSLPTELPHSDCHNCGFGSWFLAAHLTPQELRRINCRIAHQRPIKRNEYLYHAGSDFTSLNVISSGFLKTCVSEGGGHEQITGLYMTGELVGMDAIGADKHYCDTVALEDSRLCRIAFSDFEILARNIPGLQRHFLRVMGKEIVRDYGIMCLLGSMRAEQRVAIFLINLSNRFVANGYSGAHFRLPMKRQEIGSYLGLKLETVCRVLSRFNSNEILAIEGKDIKITNLLMLQQISLDNESWDKKSRRPLPRSGTY